MSDITEIKRLLAAKAQSIAEHLLPGGRKDGHEWRAGSTNGEAGKSLGVHLTGQKAGIWSDFGTGESGDLIDLWMAAKGVPISEALVQIRTYLGVERPTLMRPPRPEFKRPEKPKCHPPEARAFAYLTEDRNLDRDVLTAYKIGEEENGSIIFPFLLPDGTLALAKRRAPEDGAKPIPTQAECEAVLFGWQAIPDKARSIVLTEGEIDALSWASYGHPAMSVPFGGGGGGKQKWIESEYDRMDRFERIYLALDMDGLGEEAATEIANRLGRHRCLRVKLPEKDANECLVNGVPKASMDAALTNAEWYEVSGLRKPEDFAGKVIALFWPKDGDHVGYATPYGKLGNKLLFRPAEVSIWTGDSGAGKALAWDTPIPTINGWKLMLAIQVGDMVFDENGKPCRVTFVTEVMKDHPCYEVEFSTGEKIIADAEHNWKTSTIASRLSSSRQARIRQGRDWTKKRGTDQRHKMNHDGIVTTAQISDTLMRGGTRNHHIALTKPLDLPHVDLPLDPYVLGAWLGDGTSSDGSITAAEKEIITEIEHAGFVARPQPSRPPNCPGYGILGLRKILTGMSLLNNKHIPDEYLRAAYVQRLSLLQGLMDTDGYCGGMACEFVSTDRDLADGVYELAVSLGLKPTLKQGRATLYGKDCGPKYRVCFTTTLAVFRLKRKLDKLPKVRKYNPTRAIVKCSPVESVPVKCIQVDSPSHLYLAGHGMIPTHNTQILSDCIVDWIRQGSRVCLSSLEMHPAQTLKRMTKQIVGTDRPTEIAITAALRWASEGLMVYELTGKQKLEEMLKIFSYARSRYGCDQFVIDSLMRLGVAGDDYNTQEAVIFRIVDWAMETSAHVHLVAHSKKGERDRGSPGIEDIKGAMEIGANAFNIISIWRDRKHEDEIAKLNNIGEQEAAKKLREEKPGVVLNVAKQRNGDYEGKIGLWFDQDTYRYRSSVDQAAWKRTYLPENWNVGQNAKQVQGQ